MVEVCTILGMPSMAQAKMPMGAKSRIVHTGNDARHMEICLHFATVGEAEAFVRQNDNFIMGHIPSPQIHE